LFKNVLLATDFSERAEAARDVALSMVVGTGAQVTLVTVYHPADYILWHSVILDEGSQDEQSLEEKYLKERIEEKLRSYAEDFEKARVKVNYVIKTGKVAQRILETAAEIGADLIILGSHGHESLADVLLGGTAAAVKAKAPCTVIIASRPRRKRQA